MHLGEMGRMLYLPTHPIPVMYLQVGNWQLMRSHLGR